MYYFTKNEETLKLSEVKKYKENIQEKVLCELKLSGLAKFREIAYEILSSKDFIELENNRKLVKEKKMNLTVKLTKEEIKRLEEVKNRDNYSIISVRTEEGIEIGLIELNIINLRDREGYIKRDYYKMTFRLGSNPEDELIKYTAITEYTLRQSEIDKVLFGEHLLINTVNGKRMVLTVQK